jgi:FMN-dependent NADH-azoreductase
MQIEDGWMNHKFNNLVRDNVKSLSVNNRMAATNTAFATNRSIVSSQYINRQLVQSQRKNRKTKNMTHINFFNPNLGFLEENSLTDERTATPAKDVLPKKEQKLKYIIDKLKLT